MPTVQIYQSFCFNPEFEEKYWKPFMKLVLKDKRFDFTKVKKRKNKGSEHRSTAIRQLIIMYVDAVTRRQNATTQISDKKEIQDTQ